MKLYQHMVLMMRWLCLNFDQEHVLKAMHAVGYAEVMAARG